MARVLILSVFFVGCVSLVGDRRVVYYYPNGAKAAEGRLTKHESTRYLVAALEKKEPPAWTQYYRVGTWRYWYPNGQLRAVVQYGLGSYTECCVAGPCPGFYERLVGKPKLYDERGQLVTLQAAPRTACRDTNCTPCEIVAHPQYVLPDDLSPEWTPEPASGPRAPNSALQRMPCRSSPASVRELTSAILPCEARHR